MSTHVYKLITALGDAAFGSLNASLETPVKIVYDGGMAIRNIDRVEYDTKDGFIAIYTVEE